MVLVNYGHPSLTKLQPGAVRPETAYASVLMSPYKDDEHFDAFY